MSSAFIGEKKGEKKNQYSWNWKCGFKHDLQLRLDAVLDEVFPEGHFNKDYSDSKCGKANS